MGQREKEMNYYLHYKKWHDHTMPGYIELSKRKYQAIFDGILPKDKDASILEIGCANGMALLTLKDMGYFNIKGIELSQELAAIAKSFNLEVIEADALDYIKRDQQSYDFIFMIDVLEHLPINRIYEFLRDIYEHLNENGKLMLIVPNAISPAGSYFRYIDWTHQTSFTPTSISYLLENAGFSKTIIKEQVDDKPPRPDDFKDQESYQNALRQYNDRVQYRDFIKWQYAFYFGREARSFPLSPNIKVISEKNSKERFQLEIDVPDVQESSFSYIFDIKEKSDVLFGLLSQSKKQFDLLFQSINTLNERIQTIENENISLKKTSEHQLARIKELQASISRMENRLEQYQKRNKVIEGGLELCEGTIKKLLISYSSRKKIKKRIMYYYWSSIIKKSGEFDTAFYLQKNPDVEMANMDPVKHYILYGADEGRDPSPTFSTLMYMLENPHVVIKGINPLVDYVLSKKRKKEKR